MRAWKHIAAATLAVICLLSAAEAASAATGMEVGLQDDAVFLRTYYNINRAIGQAKAMRVGRVRVFVYWGSIGGARGGSKRKPKHVRYDFRAYDVLYYLVSQRGKIPVQFVLTGPAPAWATRIHRKGNYWPNVSYFKDFVNQTAAHFKGRVSEYSIWNEPNFQAWLTPQRRAASIYRGLYQVGWSAIKKQDPNAKVFIGETSPYGEKRGIPPLRFMRDVLCVNHSWHLKHGCSGLKTDGFATHPYDFYHPPGYRHPGADNVTLSTLSRATSALSRAARSGALQTPDGGVPYLYLTEYGYLAHLKRGKHELFSEKRRAKFLVQAFNMALANPRVKELLQYTLVPARGRYRFFDMSILDKHGRAKASYRALVKWAQARARQHQITVPY